MSGLQGIAPESAWIRATLVAGLSSPVPIVWDNTGGDPPDDAYIRMSIQRPGADNVSMGVPSAPIVRHDGLLILEVLTPAGHGTGENERLCDELAGIFRNISGDGIHFRVPHVARVGVTDGWYKQDVLCPFERDTIFT